MKLAQESKINTNLLQSVNAETIDTQGDPSKEWAKKAIIFLKDQFLSKKIAYQITILLLSAFPFGRYVIVLINALLDEAAKKQV